MITEAGNDQRVMGLEYITAFSSDKGDSVSTLIKDPQPGAPVLPILPAQEGYLLLDKAKFPPHSWVMWAVKEPCSWQTPKSHGT